MDESPSSQATLEQIRPRRWPVLVGLLAVAALAAVAGVVVTGRMSRASRDREARAWSTLQRCLVGAEPLAATETASARLRHIQLTAVGIPWREKGQDAWPGWCSARAHALHEAYREAGDEKEDGKDLSAAAEQLGKQLHDHPYPETDIGAQVDTLWARAREQNVPPSEADDVPAAPAPAQPLTIDTLRAVTPLSEVPLSVDHLHDETVPGEALRLLVVGAPGKGPQLCTAHATGDALSCAALPPSLDKVEARLLGGAEDSASPLVFASPSGETGIYRASDGTTFDEGTSYGGFARADGFAADLVWDRPHMQFRLRRGSPGQPPRDTGFQLDGVTDGVQVSLLWNAVVWAANGSISVRHVLDGDAAMGAPAVVAPVPDGGISSRRPLRACRTAQALALLVHGDETDTMTFDTGDQWSTPATFPAVSGRMETFTCEGARATLTTLSAESEAGWVEGHVTQVRCAAGACTSQRTELAKVFPDVKESMPVRLAAAGLGGKLLLVWHAGTVGGLRMRLADQDRIQEPTDVVLYDDFVEKGAVTDVSNLESWGLYARGTYAVVVMSTAAGVHALRIDAQGKVTPLKVAR